MVDLMLVQEFPLTTVLELRQNSKGQEISRRKKSLGQGFSHMVDAHFIVDGQSIRHGIRKLLYNTDLP